MQVITKNNIVKYVLEDIITIDITDSCIYTTDFTVGDLNSGNCNLYTQITNTPDDIQLSDKYEFDGTNWTLNIDWAEKTYPWDE